jgi:hypothetical protein
VVVAVLLAGGRWVSHVSVGPVYISDVLVGAAVVHAVFSRLLLGQRAGRTRGPGLLLGLAVSVTVIRLLMTQGDARLAARDAAPFAYIAIAYLSTRAYLLAAERNRRRTVRMLHGALVIHFGWMALTVLVPGSTSMLSHLGSTLVLEVRPDFDTALLGVLAGLSILRIRRKNRTWLNTSIAGASLTLALTMQSRAGLLACCACVLAALLIRPDGNDRTSARTVLLGTAATLLLLVLLPSSPNGQRLLATLDSSATSQQVAGRAQGTVNARNIAWGRVVAYTIDDPVRMAFGVGFGPDFLNLSGADVPLGVDRNPGVRSPHNYLLTSFARLGLVGLAAVSALLIALLAAAARESRAERPDELASLCVLLVVAILITAMLGVVLESPFGALPFYWAGGILLARGHRQRGEQREGGLPASEEAAGPGAVAGP